MVICHKYCIKCGQNAHINQDNLLISNIVIDTFCNYGRFNALTQKYYKDQATAKKEALVFIRIFKRQSSTIKQKK